MALLLLPLAYALLLSPIAVLDVRHAGGRATFDHVLFHEHTIEQLARTWPVAHLVDPPEDAPAAKPRHFVAMTPGFHWTLAAAQRFTGAGPGALRLVGLGLSAAILAGFVLVLARWAGPVRAVALAAPLCASVYVANSGAWLLADNAGWFWVFALLALAVRASWSWRTAVVAGGGLLLAVWTRQNLLWLALPLWAAAWLAAPRDGPGGVTPGSEAAGTPRASLGSRAASLGPMALATLPAVASLGYLYTVWDGLVPFEFQGQYRGANPSNVPLQLAMLGMLGIWFTPAIVGVGEEGWRARAAERLRAVRWWMLSAAGVSLVVAVLVPTTLAPKQGRAGLVWQLGGLANALSPAPEHLSPLLVLAASFGAGLLVFLLAFAPRRQRWVLAAGLAGFGIAQSASFEVWQRYHEPFALLFLGLATAVIVGGRRPPATGTPNAQLLPPFGLAVVLAALTGFVLWTKEIDPWRRGEPTRPNDPRLPAPQAPSAALGEPAAALTARG
ncbi:MAG: hypothetical protein AAFX79_09180 [Planctomycetota bacterium]